MGSTSEITAEKWVSPAVGVADESSSSSTTSWSWIESCPQPLMLSLNHVSFICKSVKNSVKFYENVLGFVLIKRPSSFNFEGAWLFNHGIGIHLLEAETVGNENNVKKKIKINPKDNHISFQCTDMDLIVTKLRELKVEFVTATVSEGGVLVDQLFFHDPDDYMIEICNCQNLPVLPLVNTSTSLSCPLRRRDLTHPNRSLPTAPAPAASSSSFHEFNNGGKSKAMEYFSGEMEALKMMENLVMDMMVLAF